MKKRYLTQLMMFLWILGMTVLFGACQGAAPVDNNLATQTSMTAATPTSVIQDPLPSEKNETPTLPMDSDAPDVTADPGQTAPPSPTASAATTPKSTERTSTAPTATAKKTASPTKTSTPTSSHRYTKPYVLYVNRQQNVVTVYTADENGNPVTPIKAMLCSTGRNNGTPTGTFSISDKYAWRLLFGNVYGQYACRFTGNILFHSVPYLKTDKSTLKPGEFNLLGTQASDGCVRLCVADCKWIYDNCASGTKVVVYSSSDPGPLGKPSGLIIPNDSGWDPTDPDSNNPWKTEIPVFPVTFSGIRNSIVVQRNASRPDFLSGVTVSDGIGRNVTSFLTVDDSGVNLHAVGSYTVYYRVTNSATGQYQTAAITCKVEDHTAPVVSGITTSYSISADEVNAMTAARLLAGIRITDDGDLLGTDGVRLTMNGASYTPDLLEIGKENRILLRVSDGNGNYAEITITVYVESPAQTEPPAETPAPTEPVESGM